MQKWNMKNCPEKVPILTKSPEVSPSNGYPKVSPEFTIFYCKPWLIHFVQIWMPQTFFHTLFIFLMKNALFVIHSIIQSIIQWKYSFKEFIHSKKHENYSFKEFIHSKKIQNYSFKDFIHSKKIQNNSFKKFIHSRKSKIIHSKKIFIQVKNGLSPMAMYKEPPLIRDTPTCHKGSSLTAGGGTVYLNFDTGSM